MPIWKTGNVASEPNIDFEGKPLFIVDVSAYPGMSGSPAFAIASGAYEMETGPTTAGRVQQFLGIFASMAMIEEKKFLEQIESDKKEGIVLAESLQLGHIWKAQLIIDTINNIDVGKYEKEIMQKMRVNQKIIQKDLF